MRNIPLKGERVFITGASSGIGKACAEAFASLGTNLVITARRYDRLKALADELSTTYGIEVDPIELDVQDKKAVLKVFEKLEKEEKPIDILINNAGLALSTDKLQDGKFEDWDIMIDTNIKGVLYVTRAALPSMLKREKGHIINMGSIAGQEHYPTGNVYLATKHAVRALSKSLRLDLLGTPLRVSEIQPGAVETEFSEVRWKDKERAKALYSSFTPLAAEDIADSVVYCATRPLHVNVSEIVVYPSDQVGTYFNRKPGSSDVFPGAKK